MSKKLKKKLLFTPGPLNTSGITKKATFIDLGSRDTDFIRINKSLFLNILKLGYATKGYICLPIQGSGTFSLEATFETLLSNKSKVLIVNTEGATAPTLFKELAGISAEEIVAKQ